MKRIHRIAPTIALLGLLLALSSVSALAATHYYVVANNNTSTNSVSVYPISGTSLASVTTVLTGGAGSGGGYFAEAMQSIAQDGSNTCVFAGDAKSGDVAARKKISTSPYLSVVGNYVSPDGDTATNDGLGINVSGGYLYAKF